ncbi:MAG: PHB depolymerase family esterase [Pirellulales bacterium]
MALTRRTSPHARNRRTHAPLLGLCAGQIVRRERVPVHISFHGSNSNGLVQREFTDLNTSADQHGFVVVYPYGSGDRERLLFWNAGNCCGDAYRDQVDDVGFVRALLDELYRLLPIDADRMFLSGMSNGAESWPTPWPPRWPTSSPPWRASPDR